MSGGGRNATAHYLQALLETRAVVGQSDAQLLERFVALREAASLDALVMRHGQMVWGVCRRVLRDLHDAEDAFQATFLVLARKAASIVPREKVGNWLYGVAYQTAMKAKATRARRRVREGQVPDAPEPQEAPAVRRDDLAEVLDDELSRLPDKYRAPIVLCELEGKTHGEAAEQLGWPVGTVSGRLSRGRVMLAERLTRRGVSPSGGSLAGAPWACVPAPLLSSTVQAASLVAAGLAAAEVVSPEAAALTGEVLKAMLMSRIKTATVALLAVALAGAGLWHTRTWAGEKGQPEGASRTAAADKGKALPDGKFRVTVNEVIRDDAAIVTQVDLETPPGSRIELLSDKKGKDAGATFSSDAPGPDGLCHLRVTIFGDQVELKEPALKAVKFVLHYKVGKITTSTSETVPLPADAQALADVLAVPIKSGEYPFGRPVKLATFQGVTRTLVVTGPR